MATNPSLLPENAGRLTAPDANYPYGSAKNDSTGTTGDGTPIRAPLLNDTYGFYQALLTRASLVPSGVAETALVSQLADAVAIIASGVVSAPTGFFAGFPLANNTGAPNTTIDVGVGAARSSDDTVLIKLAATVRGILQAAGAWTAGDNQNKLDTGAKAINTWYHVFAIRKTSDGSGDIIFSLSPTAPTMPVGYAGSRWVNAIRTDGSGNILAFRNYGDMMDWNSPPLDVNVATSTVDAASILSVPTGVRVLARLGIFQQAGDGNWTYRATDAAAIVPNILDYRGGGVVASANAPDYGAIEANVLTNTTGQAHFRAAGSSTVFRVVTYGWRVFR